MQNKRKVSKNSFRLLRGDESFLFFILAFDPELHLLQISMEEMDKMEVERRFKEQFGIPYDDRLRQIEFYYNQRFPTLSNSFSPKC